MRWDIINYFLKDFNPKRYLEIGSDKRNCFNRINADIKDDVDINNSPNYKCTSDVFFATIKDKQYDVVFIDGLHQCDQVLKDILNSSKILNEKGYIILHDCLPETEQSQVREDNHSVWTGDVWKAVAWLIKQGNNNIVTIKEDYGCGLISGRLLFDQPDLEELLGLTWKNYQSNKEEIMNCVTWVELQRTLLKGKK